MCDAIKVIYKHVSFPNLSVNLQHTVGNTKYKFSGNLISLNFYLNKKVNPINSKML